MSQFPPQGNPYSPQQSFHQGRPPGVTGPAISLIVVAIICLVLTSLGLVFDLYLIVSGTAANMPEPPGGISKEQQLTIRIVWGLVLLAGSVVTLVGGISMNNLKSLGMARMGAIVACVPCVGPCCLLGIPFGIWALIVLNNPDVNRSFES